MQPTVFLADKRLKFRDGSLITSHECEQKNHLFMNQDGMAQLCHGHPALWKWNKSIASVIIKAFMWIEAYDNHLKTGGSIDSYLKHDVEALNAPSGGI